jgi:predicted regulator of Ras-like GTPase activity (Roadblock/LC7/MglB family)
MPGTRQPTSSRQVRLAVSERLTAEFAQIKAEVTGVRGTLVATSDGFLVAHDVPDLDPADLAALLAASRALASQGIAATGGGQFREALWRGTHGYLAVYAAGDSAVVAVIGTGDLNVALLRFRIGDIADRIAGYASEFRRWAAAPPPGTAPGGSQDAIGTRKPSVLPVRRRAPL